MTDQPYISVVIPTFNRAGILKRVLTSLEQQEGAPSFEVIVIDDGSSQSTEEIAAGDRSYPFTFRRQANAGPGRARNHGVSLARGKYILFIGDDTVPERGFLAEHARVHREAADDRFMACLGYTGWPHGERVTAFMDYINDYGLQFGYRLIRSGEIVPFNFFYTSNISIDRELLGPEPFDTTFPAAAWEDIELAYRLDHTGLRIRYNAAAVTRHYHPTSIDSFARRQYSVGKSGAIFYRKHPELGHFLGVHEAEARPPANDAALSRLRRRARLGEIFRPLASKRVFERLMREHYLKGLRDGLSDLGSQ